MKKVLKKFYRFLVNYSMFLSIVYLVLTIIVCVSLSTSNTISTEKCAALFIGLIAGNGLMFMSFQFLPDIERSDKLKLGKHFYIADTYLDRIINDEIIKIEESNGDVKYIGRETSFVYKDIDKCVFFSEEDAKTALYDWRINK